ncbi:hypothetical protein GGF31_008909 [Allomyces arbusculus]|nr:hypothetical protein GGF31_008909 [Allomyces arbusculus]
MSGVAGSLAASPFLTPAAQILNQRRLYNSTLKSSSAARMPAASSSSSTARGARTTGQSVYGTRGPRGRLANLKEAAVPSAPMLVPITVEDEMEAFTGKAMPQTFQARGDTHGPPQEPLVPTLRQRWAFYLDTSHAGRWLDLIDAVLSLLQCALYVWNSTYVAPPLPAFGVQDMDNSPMPEPNFLDKFLTTALMFAPEVDNESVNVNMGIGWPGHRRKNAIPLPGLNRHLEVALAVAMLLVWLVRLFVASSRTQFMTRIYTLLTLISTLPVFVAFALAQTDPDTWKSYMSAGGIVYILPFRWARLHETIGLVFTPVKDPLIRTSPISRKVINVTSAIVLTLLTVTAFIHITLYRMADATSPSPTFFDVFYFTVMSSTSGLQNASVTADSWFTRALLLYIMIAGAFYIPTHLSELLTMVRERSKFTKPYKAPRSESHVLVTGKFDVNSVLEFLREFYCPDHGLSTMTTRVVMLSPHEPSEALVTVLQDPAYEARVKYVKGSSTSFRSLGQVDAKNARAAFILTSRTSEAEDAMAEDAESVMRALAIKKYNPALPVFVESILPENHPQFHFLTDQILCIEELTMGILAQAVRVPGFSTLVSLLSSSMTDAARVQLVEMADQQGAGFLKPYVRGASQEIYPIVFPPALVGKTFKEAARVIYEHFDACLIGIGVTVDRDNLPPSERFHLVLNPADYALTGVETGFVISTEVEVAMRIQAYTEASEVLLSSSFSSSSSSRGAESDDETAAAERPLLCDAVQVQIGEPSSSAAAAASSSSDTEPAPSATTKPSTTATASDNEDNDMTGADQAMLPSLGQYRSKPLISEDHSADASLAPLDAAIYDHIVLCDSSRDAGFPVNLDLFLEPLRGPLIAKPVPVVILSPNAPPENWVNRFEGVYYVAGNPLRRSDLLRAGVARARKLVIMCSGKSQSRIADAGSILTALNAESAEERGLFLVVEFCFKENFKYIGETQVLDRVRDDQAESILRPSFMAGHVFSSSLLDGLLAQSYYSPHVLSVIKRLIFTNRTSLVEKLMTRGTWATSSTPDLRAKGKRKMTTATTAVPDTDVSPLPVQSTCVHELEIPTHLAGKSYRELFVHLAEQGVVPLALYRHVVHPVDQRPFCMTIINPRPVVTLRASDSVIVLTKERM